MSDILGIGSSGITAYQRALATVSNNIANTNTVGYSRQDVSISANAPRLVGSNYLGTGAVFSGVRRQYDAFVEANLRNSNADLQSQEPMVTYVNRLIDVMGDESIGLTAAMNQFFKSGRDLATDPASTVQRSTFLRDADGLAARFRQLSTQLELLDTETRQSVQTDIGQINSLTRQLAVVNKQLTKQAVLERQPSELLDQRDLLLRELSSLTALKTSFKPNGEVLVTVGDVVSQGVLVEGSVSHDIGLAGGSSADATQLRFVLDPYSEPKSLPNLLSGKVGGTLAFREQVLGPAMDALNNLATVMASEVNAAHRGGIDIESRLGQDLFTIADDPRGAAAGITVALTDASRVAAASQFRVIDAPLNTGEAQASIRWREPAYGGPTGLYRTLAEGKVPAWPDEALTIGTARPFAPLGVAAQGMANLVIRLEQQVEVATTAADGTRNVSRINAPVDGQQLQVLTRDGRHLLGKSLDVNQRQLLMKTANGMEAGATYDDSIINQDRAYLGMDLFLGARASVQQLQQFDTVTGLAADPLPAAAVLLGRPPPAGLSGPIAADTYTLNGVSMPALAATGPLTVDDLATWINGAGAGVTASVTGDGALRLARPSADVTNDIRLGLGDGGQPSDLTRLGFDVAVHVNGVAADDLLVFVTSTAATTTTATVSAQFTDSAGDMKQALRAMDLEVRFTDSDTYEIVETGTDTVLARRDYDAVAATLSFRGLSLAFSSAPGAGDRFSIDGNTDGIGNNEAMLEIVALENSRLMPGGLTMTEAYIERVNEVGNMAQQASISRDALKVVHDQAMEARDGISGVSLDEEAAALVRFQQAYQANAKVMQVASDLFDAILQVR